MQDSAWELIDDPLGTALRDCAAPLLVLILSQARDEIALASAGFEQLTGYRSRELEGAPMASLSGSSTDLEAIGELEAALRDVRPAHVTLRHYRRDGTSFWDEVCLTPVGRTKNGAARFLSIHLDATERVDAQAALRESLRLISHAKREWEATVDALPDLVVLLDREMRVVRVNRIVEAWVDRGVRAVIGQPFHPLLHPACSADDCYFLAAWARLWRDDNTAASVEAYVADDCLGCHVQLTLRSVRPGADALRPNSAAVVLRDVSHLHEADEARRRRERFEAMGYLVAGLAHEVGNPVAAMRTTVDVWARHFDRFDRADHLRYLGRISEGVGRVQATVERILRPGSRRCRVERVAVDALLRGVERLMWDQVREKGLVLEVAAPPPASMAICGDAAALAEILTNAVKNAVEACRSGDRIMLEARASAGMVSIAVRDTGAGIAEHDMARLFVPFFSTKPTGTGIGLALANHLVEEMGGRIEVESLPGEGTTITLHLQQWG